MRTGHATWDEGLLLFLERSGYPEETYHTFSYHYSCVFRFRCARFAAAWWARRQNDQAMMSAGWMRRCANRVATRRISWTDQSIRSEASSQTAAWFFGCKDIRLVADRRQHGKSQHHQRDVAMPAVPGPVNRSLAA
jgi:hypothetical protein